MAQDLLAQLQAGEIKFADVIAYIDARYQHSPTAFQNGKQTNAATENQGSAKVFSFAQLNGLDQAQTLSLFAEHYAAVLATPEATDHQNIRQFMQNGWDGVQFDGERDVVARQGFVDVVRAVVDVECFHVALLHADKLIVEIP